MATHTSCTKKNCRKESLRRRRTHSCQKRRKKKEPLDYLWLFAFAVWWTKTRVKGNRVCPAYTAVYLGVNIGVITWAWSWWCKRWSGWWWTYHQGRSCSYVTEHQERVTQGGCPLHEKLTVCLFQCMKWWYILWRCSLAACTLNVWGVFIISCILWHVISYSTLFSLHGSNTEVHTRINSYFHRMDNLN